MMHIILRRDYMCETQEHIDIVRVTWDISQCQLTVVQVSAASPTAADSTEKKKKKRGLRLFSKKKDK